MKYYTNDRVLTFRNSTNVNEWLGVLTTKIYRYIYIFHSGIIECDKWLFTDWVYNGVSNILYAYNHSFKCEICKDLMPFKRRLLMFVYRVPPISFVKHMGDQVRWRLYRKRLGHTWLKWRL